MRQREQKYNNHCRFHFHFFLNFYCHEGSNRKAKHRALNVTIYQTYRLLSVIPLMVKGRHSKQEMQNFKFKMIFFFADFQGRGSDTKWFIVCLIKRLIFLNQRLRCLRHVVLGTKPWFWLNGRLLITQSKPLHFSVKVKMFALRHKFSTVELAGCMMQIGKVIYFLYLIRIVS